LEGRAKQWFYTNKDQINTWARCSKAFLEKFFPVGKTTAESLEDIHTVINNSTPQQKKQVWSQPRSTNQGKYQCNNYYNSSNFKQPSSRDLILEQARINDNIAKILAFNDKILEGISAKMDNFSSAVKE
jgi:hypothetical protein